MHRPPKRRFGVPEVVDVQLGELDSGEFEEPRPADAIDPLSHPLVLPRVGRPHLHEAGDRLDELWRTAGVERNGRQSEHPLVERVLRQ